MLTNLVSQTGRCLSSIGTLGARRGPGGRQDLNLRLSDYEPNESPDRPTARSLPYHCIEPADCRFVRRVTDGYRTRDRLRATIRVVAFRGVSGYCIFALNKRYSGFYWCRVFPCVSVGLSSNCRQGHHMSRHPPHCSRRPSAASCPYFNGLPRRGFLQSS